MPNPLSFGENSLFSPRILNNLDKVFQAFGSSVKEMGVRQWNRPYPSVEAQLANDIGLPSTHFRNLLDRSAYQAAKEQHNIDTVVSMAKDNLRSSGPKKTQEESTQEDPISDAFLDVFQSVVKIHSTEQMRRLFARILANEIDQPGSFSRKTLYVAAQLERSVAKSFENLCSLCCALKVADQRGRYIARDVRVPALGMDLGLNELNEYGIYFGDLIELHEYGLITSDYNETIDYGVCMDGSDIGARLSHRRRDYVLVSTMRFNPANLQIDGVHFSSVGRELYEIVEPLSTDITKRYTARLQSFFLSKNLRMKPVN